MAKKTDTSFIRRWAETRGFRAGNPVAPAFTPDGKEVLFLRSAPKSFVQSLYAFDVASGKTRVLLTPEQLLGGGKAQLSVAEKARLERQRISARGFTHYRLSRDGKKLLLALGGKLWVVNPRTVKSTPLPISGAIDPRFSPDGEKVSWVEGADLYTYDLRAHRTRRLTRGGTETRTHALAEFVAQEEMGRYTGYWWSPDARYIAYEEADSSKEELFHIADALHPERAPVDFRYPRAGKANAKVRLGILPARGGRTVWARWNAKRYPYLAKVTWTEHSPLTILVQNRTQTEEVLLSVDPKTGKTTRLLTEKDPSWIDLEPPFPVWRKDGSGFFWYTERDGGPAVEFRNARGKKLATWVKPADRFIRWVGFDEGTGWLYFTADPTQPTRALFRVKEGGKPERVGKADETPSMRFSELSRSGDRLLEISESLASMPKYEVFSTDGERLGALPSAAVKPPFRPNVQLLKVATRRPDGGFWSEVVRPRNFQPGKKLPVIVSVYGGPTVTVVNAAMGDSLLLQWIADQGFLVVRFDNRGTPGRGRAWEKAVKGNFAGVTLEDQVTALRALAKEVPELDLHRVGITGGSFGGYMSALAVLKRPDVYKAAVAISPVVDWHDYDTHYTERYLGLPEAHPEAYRKSSLLTYASRAGAPSGALLLVHGTADDNVYFFNTLKLTDALFRAGKPFRLIPLAGFTHMVTARDPRVAERLYERLVSFFHQQL